MEYRLVIESALRFGRIDLVKLGNMALPSMWARIADGIGRRGLVAGTAAASAGVMLALGCGYHHGYYAPQQAVHVYHGSGYGYGAPPVVVHHYGGGYGYGGSPVVHVHHYRGGYGAHHVVVHHYH